MTLAYASSLSRPFEESPSWAKNALLVFGGSILIALFAHVSIPLPFTPVPIVLQSHVALLLGALMGSRRGALAVLLFLMEGALGLPIFSGGKSGLLYLAGPTGGYLFGYVLGAYLTGRMLEAFRERSKSKTFLALACGNAVVYFCGLPWLSLFIGVKGALLLGLAPFIAGDCLKLILSLNALKAGSFFKKY